MAHPTGMLGVAAASIVAAWSSLDNLYRGPMYVLAAVLAATGLIALVRSAGGGPRSQAAKHVAAIGALATLWLASFDRAFVPLEARAPHLGIFARVASPLVDWVGYSAAVEGGILHVDHPEGLVSICPSIEKLGLRSLTGFASLWLVLRLSLDRRRLAGIVALGSLTLAIVAFVRFAGCVVLYLECDHILTGEGLEALQLFSSPTVDAVALLVTGLALDGITAGLLRHAGPAIRERLPNRTVWLLFAGFCGLGLLVGFAATFEPPGRKKAGRVLIDDRFCGEWEPTARQLDTEWYGDFSTYSFNSLAEWLGHRYCVDVNVNHPYTDEFLSRYDVFILKTPIRPLAEDERQAINRFVVSGKGLLLVGDHTNLLGMGTQLNGLCAPYGIRFNYDSVSDSRTGGFVNYYAPLIGKKVGALDVKSLQFMTSCSLKLGPNAEAVMVATRCRRDPHDYANPSFFGRVGPHPELAHGAVVLAATTPAGLGRIAAFTDSTVWSSFALFQYDREKLAGDLVALLNREPSPLRAPLRGISLVAAAFGVFASVRRLRDGGGVPVFLGVLLGAWLGTFAADQADRVAHSFGPPRSPIQEVSFLWQGGSCAFPPVLGSTGDLPLDRAFDTLFVAVQRLGLVPHVAYTYDSDLFTIGLRAIFVVAPYGRPPPEMLPRLESFVKRGGSLIVVDDGRLGGNGSAPDFLKPFGVKLRYSRIPGQGGNFVIHSHLDGIDDLTGRYDGLSAVLHRTYGSGHVLYLRESTQLSRTGIGHCFARPGKVAKSRYEAIYSLLRDVSQIDVGDRRYYGIID